MMPGHYIIATYGLGNRRCLEDPGEVLDYHLAHLATTPHTLDRITVAVPDCNNVTERYIQRLIHLQDRNVGAPMFILRRRNRFFSYGSFMDAATDEPTILTEDDYVFLPPHFDTRLMALQEEVGANYLCGAHAYDHAAHACGIIDGMVLKEARRHFECDSRHGGDTQHAFSRAIQMAGGMIRDWTAWYRSGFLGINGVTWFGTKNLPIMVYPVQPLLKGGMPS